MNLRRLTGIAAVLLLAVAANLAIWSQSASSVLTLAAFGAALLCALVWLALTILHAARNAALPGQAAGGLYAGLSTVIFLGICIVLYAFVQRLDIAMDLTSEGRRSLAPQTVQVLQTMTREVTATCFFLDTDDEIVKIGQDKSLRFLDQCAKYTSLLKVEVIDPQVAVAQMQAMNLPYASPQGTIVIHAGTRQRVITLTGGSPRLEERDFTNALINVLRTSEPKVGYLTGHNERKLDDTETGEGAAGFLAALQSESYAVQRIAIQITAPEIPRDVGILIVNNPVGDLRDEELRAIDAFLDRGGRLFMMLDPWIRVNPGLAGGERLRPWLESRLGIAVGSDLVLNQQQQNPYDANLTADESLFEDDDTGVGQFRGSFHVEHPITRNFDQTMLLQAARTVQPVEELPDGLVVSPLLRTTPGFWAETDIAALSETGNVGRSDEEPLGPQPLAAVSVGLAKEADENAGDPRDFRAVIVGNSVFASNAQIVNVGGNLNFVMNAMAWLSETEDLIAIRPSGKEDPAIFLSPLAQRGVAWVSTLFTVQAIVLMGLVVYAMRRRYQ